MDKFQELPEESLLAIFAHLDPIECLKYRRVSKSWKEQLLGCAAFSWRLSSSIASADTQVVNLSLKGYRVHKISEDSNAILDGEEREEIQRRDSALISSRTKGQLPQPGVITTTRGELANEAPFHFRTFKKSVAFRMEEHGNDLIWDTVDASLSSCLMLRSQPQRRIIELEVGDENVERPILPLFRRTKPLLKRIMTNATFSSLPHLKRLSLRGCTSLRSLYVPSHLEALDVSCCTELSDLVFPACYQGKLEALNIRGCRSLRAQDRSRLFGSATRNVMKYVEDMDFSSTRQIDPSILADAIRMTTQLESVSLRYIASSSVIQALAESSSASTRLRYIDASFSSDLGDEACEVLVNAACHLERFNLRGCGGVSSSIYNSIPIWLTNRQEQHKEIDSDIESQSAASEDIVTPASFSGNLSSTAQNRRKGDVVFCAPAVERNKK